MSSTVIALIVLAALALIVIYIYNSLVRTKVRTDEAWSDISVQLKRRYDLIPNLVNTVRDLNTKIQTFPTNIFASLMGFKQRDFFEVDDAEASAVSKPVNVDFSTETTSKK
jgi:hypothetical protein